MSGLVIRTSADGWAKNVAVAYKEKHNFTLIDDAGLGVDPRTQSLFDMTRRARLGARDIFAVIVSCGVGFVGAALLLAAFLDPEPLSKMGLAVGGGTVMVLTGAGGAYYILTGLKPPSVSVAPNGIFSIRWE